MSLKLFTENTERSEPIVPLRWCADRGTLDRLQEMKVLEPLLFISIQNKRGGELREVFRALVPLEQMMEYVQLNHSGKHIIRAFIVWAKGEDEVRLYNYVLSERRRGDYEYRMYPSDGNFDEGRLTSMLSPGVHLHGVQAELEVHVGTEFFAPEPSTAEKRWVNLWFGNEAFDQCDFRRRRFIAYTIQPVALAIWIPWITFVRAVIGGILIFHGAPGVLFTPVFHPFRNSTDDVYNDSKESIFWTDKDGNERSRFFLLLYPPFLTLFAGVLYLINLLHIWKWAGIVVGVLSILATLTIIGIFLGKGVLWLIRSIGSEKIREAIDAVAKVKKPAKPKLDPVAEALKRMYDELQLVACDGVPLPAKVAALPKPRQSIHLKLQALKARVCRPYAKH